MQWIIVLPDDAPDAMKEKLERHFEISKQTERTDSILRRGEWNQDLRPDALMGILSLDGEIESELDKIDEWFLDNVVGFRDVRLVVTKIGPHLSELNDPAKKRILAEILNPKSDKNFFSQVRERMNDLKTEAPPITAQLEEQPPPPASKAAEGVEAAVEQSKPNTVGFNFHDQQQTTDVIEALSKMKKAGVKIELPDLNLAIGQGSEDNEVSWDEMIAMVKLVREFGAQNVKWKKEIMFK